MTVTIRDVAARAGVSIATVSRVMNGAAGTSDDVSSRVRAAVAALGFRPNLLGRGLKTAKSRTVGVMIPSLSNPVFAGCVEGIERAARRAGYSVLLTSSGYDAAHEREVVETLLANRVAGMVLTVADADHSPTLDLLDDENQPYVLLFNEPTTPGRSAVAVDNAGAAEQVVGRLVAAGHRRIAMVAGALGASDRSRLRLAGFERALAKAGLVSAGLCEVTFDDPDLIGAVRDLIEGPNAPTALFCSNDMVAIATIGALRTLGRRVPADMSVAGFDGIAVGQLIDPALATVAQPTALMGDTALTMLLDVISGAPAEGLRRLDHLLLDGASIASPLTSH